MVSEWYLGFFMNNHFPTVQWYLNGISMVLRGIMAKGI